MILTLYYCVTPWLFTLAFTLVLTLRLSRTVKPSCISTASLKTSQPLHAPPIKLVVYQRTYQVTL